MRRRRSFIEDTGFLKYHRPNPNPAVPLDRLHNLLTFSFLIFKVFIVCFCLIASLKAKWVISSSSGATCENMARVLTFALCSNQHSLIQK
jgi:hypothetical protein